ncbi:MAG: hypothetical protein A2Z96_06540 [Spirochaetes bacterium GWB1_48_6]|nr:MAG: hypothetical protein A2Z96_06540 [Spirochaetes bacterium GWB1_48_6]
MRKLRVLVQNASYHVCASANRKEFRFIPDEVKDLFEKTIQDCKKKYNFKIENYVIMSNHFHFIIHPSPGESLSTIMKWILGVFAMRYNRRFETSGHFWEDRFFSRVIESLTEYLRVSHYIDENPVKANLSSNKNLWRWSGFFHRLMGWVHIVENLRDRPLNLH